MSSKMLAVDQIQQFYLYKKRTDSRFSVPTVVDLFLDNDDDGDNDRSYHCRCHLANHYQSPPVKQHRVDLMQTMEGRREKMRKALNKHRYLTEELNLAVEQLATDRANLMLERHLLAVTKERLMTQKELGSPSTCIRELIRSKFKGIPPESVSVESFLDVDKNNNSKESSSSKSDTDSGRNFQASVMIEERLRKQFPKLRERSRNLTNMDEATKLREDIKLQEEILNYLYLKVEAIIFRKSFKKPTKNLTCTALVPLSSFSTPKIKPDDKRRKRKQLISSSATSSRLRTAESSDDARSSGVGSIDNLFRDVVTNQMGAVERGNSPPRRTASSSSETFRQVTIDVVDS